MIEDRNIICIASNWFYDPTSKHHVMRELSRRNHIVWVNYHGSRRPRIASADVSAVWAKLREWTAGPRRVADNITVVTPLVAPLPGSAAAAALNRRLLVRQIRRVLGDLPERPVQLWSFAPDVDYLCGCFGEEAVVYYCVDAFSAFTGYDRDAILAAERRLAARADLVVTTSRSLTESKRGLNPNMIEVTHGVDHAHFATATDAATQVPDDIAAIPGPRLGFWGLIQDWIDVDLVAALARARPDWSIVLIGEAATSMARVGGLANVHVLGRRPYERLPAYARAFDVGLIPFRINELTRAVNPIKLREYLSAGLPVVSTPLPEVARYRALVHVADGAAAFVAACARALGEQTPAQAAARQQAMAEETWPVKVEMICARLVMAVGDHRIPAAEQSESARAASPAVSLGR